MRTAALVLLGLSPWLLLMLIAYMVDKGVTSILEMFLAYGMLLGLR